MPIRRVPDGGRGGNTFGSLVMELGETPPLQVAPGQPDRTPYEVLEF